MRDNKAFCMGILCRKTDRRYKSIVSDKVMCKECAVDLGNNEYCSIDELFTSDDTRILKAFNLLTDEEINKKIVENAQRI